MTRHFINITLATVLFTMTATFLYIEGCFSYYVDRTKRITTFGVNHTYEVRRYFDVIYVGTLNETPMDQQEIIESRIEKEVQWAIAEHRRMKN